MHFPRRALHGSRANADGADDIQLRLSAVVKPKPESSGEHRTRLSETRACSELLSIAPLVHVMCIDARCKGRYVLYTLRWHGPCLRTSYQSTRSRCARTLGSGEEDRRGDARRAAQRGGHRRDVPRGRLYQEDRGRLRVPLGVPVSPPREIRRRTRVVGTFQDGNSALMLVTARLKHIVEHEWR